MSQREMIIDCLMEYHHHDKSTAEKIMSEYGEFITGYSFSAVEISNILNEAYRVNVTRDFWREHVNTYKENFTSEKLLEEGMDKKTKLKKHENGEQIPFNDFAFFEKSIAKALVLVFRYSIDDAVSLINEYLSIIHLLDSASTGADEWAVNLIGAKIAKITKQDWLNHIKELDL